MGKLNQVIAVVAGKKQHATKVLTDVYHKAQKPELFSGISRTYRPQDDTGEKLPPESKAMQNRVAELVNDATAGLVEMYDVVATQDYANTQAKSDIELDGKVILKDVPVTHLLFLEKQMTDLATFIGKLPTLDPSESWQYDPKSDCYATVPSETTRTKKVPKAFVKAVATDQHPAQVDVFTEDVLVGYWQTIKFSGAIPAKDRNTMAERVRRLHEAVTKAREQANGMEISTVQTGKPIMDFVFGTSAVSG